VNQILRAEVLKIYVDPSVWTVTVQNGAVRGKRRKDFVSHLIVNSLVIAALAIMNFQNNSEFTMWLFYRCTFIRRF